MQNFHLNDLKNRLNLAKKNGFSKKLKVDAKYLKFVFSFKTKIEKRLNHVSQVMA